MLIHTVRKPGEPGTQKLVARYGERLVSVRYRYDPAKGKRYKTVELIVAEEDWRPPAESRTAAAAPAPKPRTTPRVPVRIQYFEKVPATPHPRRRWTLGPEKETVVRTGGICEAAGACKSNRTVKKYYM